MLRSVLAVGRKAQKMVFKKFWIKYKLKTKVHQQYMMQKQRTAKLNAFLFFPSLKFLELLLYFKLHMQHVGLCDQSFM